MLYRLVVFVSILLIFSSNLYSQTIGNYQFLNLPQDYQLYPRNAKNQSDISIKVSSSSTEPLKLIVYRNQKQQQVVKPVSSGNSFIFNTTIQSELAAYDFHFYKYQGGDSVLIVKRSNIVSGDVILVTGQSNAKLGPMDKNVYQGEWLRTYGKNKVIQDLTKSYDLADTLWNTMKLNLALDPIAADYLGLGLGPFAPELARIIIEDQKIPVAVISNAQPSTNIDFHLNMNGDLKAPKGGDILYFKVAKAGLLEAVKTIVYIQSEAEILANVADTWIPKFAQLKSKWKSFFPNLSKIATPQLNIFSFQAKNSAKLRNEQRKLKEQSDIIAWANLGNPGFDGLHYYGNKYLSDPNNLYLFENKGYLQMAQEVGRIILKEVYQKTLPSQIYSPNLVKAYFPDLDIRNKVILEFDEGQNLRLTQDTTVVDQLGVSRKHLLKNNFFYDRYNTNSMGPYIKSISASGNKVTLEFNVDYDGNTISYMPEFHQNFEKDKDLYPFPGPYIKNAFGMRAFAFSDIFIEERAVYSDNFKLWPNPTSEYIEMIWKTTVNGKVICTDLLGREIFTSQIANSRYLFFNLTDFSLKSGIYFIKFISDSGGTATQKFIKL